MSSGHRGSLPGRPGRLVRPDLVRAGPSACLARILLSPGVALPGRGHQSVASTMCPPIARQPRSLSWLPTSANSVSSAPTSRSFSRNRRVALASGVAAPGSKPKKRSQLSRARIRYSIHSVADAVLYRQDPYPEHPHTADDRPWHHRRTPTPQPGSDETPRNQRAAQVPPADRPMPKAAPDDPTARIIPPDPAHPPVTLLNQITRRWTRGFWEVSRFSHVVPPCPKCDRTR